MARRGIAASIATLAQMSGLVVLPMIAQLAIGGSDWRAGWIAVGATVLIVGFVPCWLLLVRRPEDVGLQPDRLAVGKTPPLVEPRWSRAQAMRTPAFWLLSLHRPACIPVQAGVSLHQAPHLIERGVSPVAAAAVIAFVSRALGGGELRHRLPAAWLAGALPDGGVGGVSCFGSYGLIFVYVGGGPHCRRPLFFGVGSAASCCCCRSPGPIISTTKATARSAVWRSSLHVSAQAAGPLVSSMLRDWSGNYTDSLLLFGAGNVAGRCQPTCLAANPVDLEPGSGEFALRAS